MYIIKNDKIYTRSIDKFSALEDGQHVQKTLLADIRLISDVDKLLKENKVDSNLKDISAASGETTCFTVPDGKKWKVTAFYRAATTGNSRLRLRDIDAGKSMYMSASGTAELIYENVAWVLEEKDIIQLENTNNGADTSIYVSILYEEEDAF